ncbi:phosphotyrosine protein [Rickenella mellea]|uniref:protein-tyrosine-phosphatase n=1 Tax=Rickenella mellea TaxID=50990 RepID=A0A4Y7QI67_9AGAM|nr:phosphotyrosine protein [Rickenella mellea]
MPMATEIIPRLYMCDLTTAETPATYAMLGITHVLSVMPGNVHIPQNGSLPWTLQIPIRDQPFEELAGHLSRTTQFIAEGLANPRGKVLVHCVQGMSRSASVVSAYLMAAYGWSVVQAVEFVRSKHSTALPNRGFVHQLQEYSVSLQSRSVC